MYLNDFKYHKPTSVAEVFNILESSESPAILAGGTDFLVEMKQGLRKNSDVISIADLIELKKIYEDDDNVYIGPGCTFSEIIKSELISKYCPAIAEAVSQIGTPQIRNTATIGGNLCTAASCADSAPILMVYDARLEIKNQFESKIIPLKDLFVFHKKTILKKSEILFNIIVPKQRESTGTSYQKFGHRNSASISVASAAVLLSFDNNVCTKAVVVVGACAPTPVQCSKASAMLIGLNKDIFQIRSEIIDKIAETAANETYPIDDIRGTVEYRKELTRVLVRRAVLESAKRASKNFIKFSNSENK